MEALKGAKQDLTRINKLKKHSFAAKGLAALRSAAGLAGVAFI